MSGNEEASEAGSTGNSSFPETNWSLVRRAADKEAPESFHALSKLCESYWYPLYAYVRREGASPEDAADEVQGFFARMLEKEYLRAANRDLGRLRTFLIDAIKKYRAKEYRAKQAQKRGGGLVHVSIDRDWAEMRYSREFSDSVTAEQLLDQSWARLMIDRVIYELTGYYRSKGREKEIQLLQPFLGWDGDEGASYAEIGRELGISESNVKVKVHRMRSRCRALLKAEVARTLDYEDESAAKQELTHLLSTMR